MDTDRDGLHVDKSSQRLQETRAARCVTVIQSCASLQSCVGVFFVCIVISKRIKSHLPRFKNRKSAADNDRSPEEAVLQV